MKRGVIVYRGLGQMWRVLLRWVMANQPAKDRARRAGAAPPAAARAWHGLQHGQREQLVQHGTLWHSMAHCGTAQHAVPRHSATRASCTPGIHGRPWAAGTVWQSPRGEWQMWLLLALVTPGAPSWPRHVLTLHWSCQGPWLPSPCRGQHTLAQNVHPTGSARNGKAQGAFRSTTR